MESNAISTPVFTTHVVITTADGKKYDLGRVDSKFPWRLWFYKYITYPRLARKAQQGGQ